MTDSVNAPRPEQYSSADGVPALDCAELNRRIVDGSAVVCTLAELCQPSRDSNATVMADLVTVAFPTDISGSAAMMVVPVASRGVFTRAEEIFVNHVRGHPGPAPNERLGVVDTLIFADEPASTTDSGYDGSALFLDLIRGKRVEVECHSVEETIHRNEFALADLEFARFYVYNARLPVGADEIKIVRRSLVPGTRIALNGSQGVVVGIGTRSRPGALSLSLAADMHEMDAALMVNAAGRPYHIVALALNVRDESELAALREWGRSHAAEAFFGAAATKASVALKQMIEENRFHLSEIGSFHGRAMEG